MSTLPSISELESKLLILQDEPQPCPYIEGETARMPLRWPRGDVSPPELDVLLERGYRRSGPLLYRPQCPNCSACQATRLEVDRFRLRRSQRRVLNRGDRLLRVEHGPPHLDAERLALFNRHRIERHLDTGSETIDVEAYRCFLVDTCCQTQELTFWLDEDLVAVATVDVGHESLSAVYTYFRPDLPRLSLGTYAILKSIEWAQANAIRWYYLGFYVAENAHLNYKHRFLPQQRFVGGAWQEFPAESAMEPPRGG